MCDATIPDLAAKCLALAGATPKPIAVDVSEKDFQLAVVDLAERHGWKCYHVTIARRSKAGWFDLTCLHEARRLVLFAELKSENGQATAEQITWGEVAAAIGGNVLYRCWRPCDWADVERVLTGDS